MPVERVTVLMGDTNYPPTAGSGGSYGAATSGAAVLVACQKLKAGLASGMTEAEGSVTPAALSSAYSHAGFGAHFVEAAVHRDTGEVRVRRMLGVFAAGRILNPKTARSQMLGGMTWGIGSALMEGNSVDHRYGSFIAQDLANYHVAVNADIGQMDVVFCTRTIHTAARSAARASASWEFAAPAPRSSTPSTMRPAPGSATSPPPRTSFSLRSRRSIVSLAETRILASMDLVHAA